MTELTVFLQSAKAAILAASNTDALEQLRVHYLGKKGALTELLKSVGQMSAAERPLLGKAINEAKVTLHTLIEEKSQAFIAADVAAQLAHQKIDVTLAGRGEQVGTLHPITAVGERIVQLLTPLGFKVVEGPEIEDDYHNFAALNMPADHAARSMQDTFYFSHDRLLRTHTSPMQIREMEKNGVPIRLLARGRVYRRDFDQTHTPMFHQVEGLVVDKQCTFANLKWLLQDLLNQFFEKSLQLRFRPSYFPFMEPSAEVDIYHESQKRWLEVLGCGMVHPNVLRNVGVDPDTYTGFAFGIGLDRLAMLRYDVCDLRLFFENDLRFLSQF